ncbi:MAG: hypothetical protein DRI26_09785, partial [Chloroflexi bacterium]
MFKCKLKVLLILCGVLGFSLNPTVALQGSDSIKIGGLFPFTGRLADYGLILKNATELAVEQINAQGGILGRWVELIIEDTGSDPSVAYDRAVKLIEVYGVSVIIGPLSGGATMPVSSVTVLNQVVLIPFSSSPIITILDDNGFVFRTSTSAAMLGVALAQAALSKGYERIALIARDDAYAVGVANSLRTSFENLGGAVTSVSLYDPGTSDFSAQIAAASADNPDAISLVTWGIDGEQLITQMVAAGVTNFDLFTDGLRYQDLWDQLCGQVGPGVLEGKVGMAFGSTITWARAERFVNDYRDRYGEAPSIFAANAYDAIMVVALAIARADEVSGTAIRDNLCAVANPPGEVVTYAEISQALSLLVQGEEINYEGVSGLVDFDEWGDTTSAVFELWRIEGCEVVTQELVEVSEVVKLVPELSYLLEDPYNRIAEFPEEIQRQVQDSGTIPVAIWLNAPLPDEIVNRSNEFKESVGEGWSLDEVREWRQEVFEDKSAWYADVEEEVVQFLNTNGFWDEDRSYACLAAPVLYTDLPVDPSERRIFEELRRLNVVDTIYLAGVFEPKLDSAVPTIEAPSVWSRKDSSGNNLRGTNVRIAIVESGRIDFTLAPFASSKRNH